MTRIHRMLSPCTGPSALLTLLLALGSGSVSAESLHARPDEAGATALVEQVLAALAEDPRSNRLLLLASQEQLRSFLLQRLCPGASVQCGAAGSVQLHALPAVDPTGLSLLLQSLDVSLQARGWSRPQRQHLLEQLTLQPLPATAAQPLAAL